MNPPTPSPASRLRHTHTFGQDQKKPGETRTLFVIGLTAVMMVLEITAGLIFGSMALLADGMHMASHAMALTISAVAYVYARRHSHDDSFCFGTGKVNALGGFTGAVLLAIFAMFMAWESVHRMFHPVDIAFNQAILVAVLGLLVNGASVLILGHHHHHDHDHHSHGHGHDHDHHHSHHPDPHPHDHSHKEAHGDRTDLNLRSAYLHVLADALTSITAILALLAAKFFGWVWMDPLTGIVGGLLVARWSFDLLRQTSSVLLDRQAPEELLSEVRSILRQEEQAEITDLHVWSIAPGSYGVILALTTSKPLNPETLKSRLDPHRFPHVTVEINPTT